jgi:4-hydroxythreonine-4-phosphate dehydrogenase
VLFTDRSIFERNLAFLGTSVPNSLSVIDLGGGASEILWGQCSALAGQRAIQYLQAASDAALAGEIQAIVTAPVNKAAIGGDFHGQTEFLADRAACPRFAMAFFTPTFKVVLATIHVSLRTALDRLSTELYVGLIRFVDSELRRLGFERPRIAVAAINPHAGEGGMFGSEDDEILLPAIQLCAAEGIAVTGPHPADSLYHWAHTGGCDVVIAPYHDQGLIPVKLIAHGNSTNVTLGLPYIRTSPDHGTAFAIAGKGQADPSGMIAAMKCAVDLVRRSSLV